MNFEILGPLRIVRDGATVDLGRAQQRLLLARLLVDAGHPVSTDRLVDDLWGDAAPPGATDSLQALVSRLRRVLEPDRRPRDPATVLVTRAPGYALIVDDEHLDAARFSAEAAAGAAALANGDASGALTVLASALGRWRGPVLADVADAPFVAPIAAHMEELHTAARQDHAAALAATGALAPAIASLEALAHDAPWRERTWELLAAALHQAGRTADALDRLRDVRARFADDLGLDVGPGLRALETSLLRGEDVGAVLPPARLDITASPAAPPAVPAPPPAAAGDDPVVGRLRETALVEEAVEQVVAGSPRWVALVGEPGIGKTRLAEHATSTAQALGARVAWGRAHEDRAMPALWPWVQVLRALDIGDAGTLLGAGVAGDLVADRFERCDRVARALTVAARSQPLLVVLDDLQWADAESLGLLDLLAGELRDVGIGVVATIRSTETTDAVDRVVHDLTRRPGGARLDLVGLDAEATGALAAVVRGVELDPDEVQVLQARTGGNPYFVTEFSRLGSGEVSAHLVPDGVRDVLRRRLAPLPDAVRALLGMAAVAGLEFDADLLADAVAQDRTEVTAGLAVATDARVLRAAGDAPGRYLFTHALMRAVLRDDLADLDRRRHHLALADALAVRADADPDRWLPERAGHLVGAAPLSDAAMTTDACEAAARLAEQRLAHEEAVAWRTRALQSIDGDGRLAQDRARRVGLLVDLGMSYGDAGDHPNALATLAQAIDGAEALGDTTTMARAAQAFDRAGGFWYWVEQGTRPVALLDRIDRTLAALGDADSPERVRVLVVRAAGEYYGDHDLGMALAAEARAIAERLGDPVLIADALVGTLAIGWRPVRMPEQRVLADDLLARARALGLRRHELVALTHQFVGALTRGDVREAERCHTQAMELAAELRHVLVTVQLGWSRAMFAGLRGDFPAAHSAAARAEELHRRTGLYAVERAAGQTVGMLAWEQGTLDQLPTDRRAMVMRGFPEARIADAHRQGDLASARRLLADITAEPPPPSYESIGLLSVHARLAADLGEVALAHHLRAALAPHVDDFGDFGSVACTGPVRLQLGRLDSLLGDHAHAVTRLEACVDDMLAQHLPVWHVRAREALAVALRRRGGPGDTERATTLQAAAIDDAAQLGVAIESHVADALPASDRPRPAASLT